MDRNEIEKLFERETPFEIPQIPDLNKVIPDIPRKRKIHSKSSVANSTDYIEYKELRHRQLIVEQVNEEISQRTKDQLEFDTIRQFKSNQDAAKTEKKRLRRYLKKAKKIKSKEKNK
eukprot:NODE_565_length_6632_cov_0.218276.p3 type:complete len:117 gc:universal NODE_565_length_6632_cov_0.218276:3257-2907(-)